jgi:hypothetical protein
MEFAVSWLTNVMQLRKMYGWKIAELIYWRSIFLCALLSLMSNFLFSADRNRSSSIWSTEILFEPKLSNSIEFICQHYNSLTATVYHSCRNQIWSKRAIYTSRTQLLHPIIVCVELFFWGASLRLSSVSCKIVWICDKLTVSPDAPVLVRDWISGEIDQVRHGFCNFGICWSVYWRDKS